MITHFCLISFLDGGQLTTGGSVLQFIEIRISFTTQRILENVVNMVADAGPLEIRRLNLAQNELVTHSACVTNDLLRINITIRLFGSN